MVGTIGDMTPAVSFDGTELFEIEKAGATASMTLQDIIDEAGGGGGSGVGFAQETAATPFGNPGWFAIGAAVETDGGWIDFSLENGGSKEALITLGGGADNSFQAYIQAHSGRSAMGTYSDGSEVGFVQLTTKSDETTLVVKGETGQTSNPFQVKKSATTVLAITPDGSIELGTGHTISVSGSSLKDLHIDANQAIDIRTSGDRNDGLSEVRLIAGSSGDNETTGIYAMRFTGTETQLVIYGSAGTGGTFRQAVMGVDALASGRASVFFEGAVAGRITIGDTYGGGSGQMCFFDIEEMTSAPSQPSSNHCRIWIQDNGSGKSRLMCRFGSGAAIQLAIEP